MSISLSDFSYRLPEKLIAQHPAYPRDSSRLMVLDRQSQKIEEKKFFQIIDYLGSNDVLVLNDSKVFPARLKGHKASGKVVEVLLLRKESFSSWWAMSFPGLKVGNKIQFDSNKLNAEVKSRDAFSGQVLLEFNQAAAELIETIYQIGQTPIPPYIKSEESRDMSYEARVREEYQTVFAKEIGSAAAPTAGLHFTQELLEELRERGVQIEYVTLHVGPGTFQRLWQENIDQEKLHTEWYEIENSTAQRLGEAKQKGKRIIAVGTTATRTLESALESQSIGHSELDPESIQWDFKTGWQTTELFIQPGYKFKFIDGLITNFHLPKSSLLMLVSAFTSSPQSRYKFTNFDQSLVGNAYQKAISENYRFYSFGDAMFIY